MEVSELKKKLGYAVVDDYVKSGMKLGLGTGSTAVWAVRRLAEKVKTGELKDLLCVPTSSQTELECQSLGIPLLSLNDLAVGGELDLTFDGADEVDAGLNLTKGGGGALVLEKITAYASKRMIVMVDSSKIVQHLGLDFPIPTEVLKEARLTATRAFEALGAAVQVRMAVKKMGPVITDNGNLLLDLTFKTRFDPREMEERLSRIPGVLGNGIFSRARVTLVLGHPDGRLERREGQRN